MKKGFYPFYTLRSFLDAEYGIILGYGFYCLAEKLLGIRTVIKYIYQKDRDPDNFILFFNELLNTNFLGDIITIVFITIIIVIFIDNFCISRILTLFAPCRSIGRFGLDVIIGFLFGISFVLISTKSTLAFGTVGVAFFTGSLWAYRVQKEANQWEKETKTIKLEEPYTPKIIGEEWKLYNLRLDYIKNIYLTYAFFLVGSMFLIISFDPAKKYWGIYLVIFFISYFIFATIHFYYETSLFVKANIEISKQEYYGVLKTVIWIPLFFKEIIAKKKEEGKK